MSKKYNPNNEVRGSYEISGVARVGEKLEFRHNDSSYILGPIRLGQNWFQIGDHEACVTGISDDHPTESRYGDE